MAAPNIIRIAVVALGLSTLSFAAGVAGDLSSIEPQRSGQRVVLRIPPEIPADAPRAGPLLSTASAQAAPLRLVRYQRREEFRSLVEAVQVAHEEAVELAPVVFESAPAQRQKPQVQAEIKPAPEARAELREAKAA